MKRPKIEIVLELTRDEALALVALVGDACGDPTLYDIYGALWPALSKSKGPGAHSNVYQEAKSRFPSLSVR